MTTLQRWIHTEEARGYYINEKVVIMNSVAVKYVHRNPSKPVYHFVNDNQVSKETYERKCSEFAQRKRQANMIIFLGIAYLIGIILIYRA
jgi:hypothetical protein